MPLSLPFLASTDLGKVILLNTNLNLLEITLGKETETGG